MKKELKDAVNEDIDKFRGEMEELIGEVEGLVGKIADLVTSVELVKSYAIDTETKFDYPIALSTAIEKTTNSAKTLQERLPSQRVTKCRLRVSSWFAFLRPMLF